MRLSPPFVLIPIPAFNYRLLIGNRFPIDGTSMHSQYDDRCGKINEVIQQASFTTMVEVHYHGFSFEKWVRDTLFGGYSGNYMQKWDIPPDFNHHENIPEHCRSMPVSVKSAKYGSPIGLGDINRQRIISEPFLMIVGFWRQRTESEKWIEDIGVAVFDQERWSALWGHLSVESIHEIDERIKDLSTPYAVARVEAQTWKQTVAEQADSRIVVNPKIDSKKQRRIQCSLPFQAFWESVGREPTISDTPSLFGFAFANPILSGPRTFNRD